MLDELQPGDPVQVGPYRLAGVLGAGGMGRVFLGLPSGGRPVAVKVIRPELAADPEFRVRFRREVDAARAISGQYTAELIDADTDGPVPWLATAYLDRPSLSEAVTSYGPLPVASVRALAAGLAEALAAVHAMGLVHRDLKPSNVLLGSDGPRVIDFGISRAADATALTSTGQFIGSPGYLSPEQAIGRQVGPPSDIFSLGAVLCFAASGNGPFGTGSTSALVYRVVHEPPTMEGVPEELQPLIGMCLAKEPEDRPTAGDLVAELSGAQRPHERTAAARAGFAEPTQSGPGAGASGASPAAGAVALGSGGPRRRLRLRRSLLIPVASAAAVVARRRRRARRDPRRSWWVVRARRRQNHRLRGRACRSHPLGHADGRRLGPADGRHLEPARHYVGSTRGPGGRAGGPDGTIAVQWADRDRTEADG